MNNTQKQIWQLAKPYLNTRQNDIHTWYCFRFAQRLVSLTPESDAKVVLPAILLHDVGWRTVPEDKQLQSFGPHMIYPELRRQHEVEGAKIAREILTQLAYAPGKIEEIATIIDGHDTRQESLSINDALVKDADKLWRYTPFGLQTVAGWFGYSHDEMLALLEKWLGYRFYTGTAVSMAHGLLTTLLLQQEKQS